MLRIIDYVNPSPQQMIFVCNSMRNPKNSWNKMDSIINHDGRYILGPNDADLMKRLASAGSDHRKFMRQIPIMISVKAPIYWWKEFDTYKVGTVPNSCSTMHTIMHKEFEMSDFSFENIDIHNRTNQIRIEIILNTLNDLRDDYLKETVVDKRKDIWYEVIQFLPSAYNQIRSYSLNYEVLRNIYHARKDHKLDEWHVFCEWIESLPLFDILIKE